MGGCGEKRCENRQQTNYCRNYSMTAERPWMPTWGRLPISRPSPFLTQAFKYTNFPLSTSLHKSHRYAGDSVFITGAVRVCNFLFDFFFDPRINLEAAVWFSNMWELSRKIIGIIFSLTSCSWWYESLQMYYFMAKHMPHLREAASKERIFCRWEFCVLQTGMTLA